MLKHPFYHWVQRLSPAQLLYFFILLLLLFQRFYYRYQFHLKRMFMSLLLTFYLRQLVL